MEPSLNPCSLVVAPSVFISLADTWLSCQSNMLQPVPKQQHSRVIRYKFPLSHLSTHSQLLGVVINLPTKLLLLTPGFVFMFAKSWGHKTCLYGIGDCSQLRLTTAVMLGRWLEVKVTRLRSVSLLQTNTTPLPSPAKHHPCYLLCSQCGSPAHWASQILSVLCNHNHQHWGRGREEDTDGDYCFLELAVCNIQIIPTWLWG